MKTTKQKLIEWGWTNGNGQPLSWKYWWTYWRKKEEDEDRHYVRHNYNHEQITVQPIWGRAKREY